MSDTILNLRRLLRNRFETYLADRSYDTSGEIDGSAYTLLELCEILKHDPEPFPRYYDRDLTKFCGHEARVWFREGRSYGDVARLTAKHVSLSLEGQLRSVGIWVGPVLKSADHSVEEAADTPRPVAEGDYGVELDYVVSQDEPFF